MLKCVALLACCICFSLALSPEILSVSSDTSSLSSIDHGFFSLTVGYQLRRNSGDDAALPPVLTVYKHDINDVAAEGRLLAWTSKLEYVEDGDDTVRYHTFRLPIRNVGGVVPFDVKVRLLNKDRLLPGVEESVLCAAVGGAAFGEALASSLCMVSEPTTLEPTPEPTPTPPSPSTASSFILSSYDFSVFIDSSSVPTPAVASVSFQGTTLSDMDGSGESCTLSANGNRFATIGAYGSIADQCDQGGASPESWSANIPATDFNAASSAGATEIAVQCTSSVSMTLCSGNGGTWTMTF